MISEIRLNMQICIGRTIKFLNFKRKHSFLLLNERTLNWSMQCRFSREVSEAFGAPRKSTAGYEH